VDFSLGGAIAMLVYSGGIYRTLHTVLVLGVYAAPRAARSIGAPARRARGDGAARRRARRAKLLPLIDAAFLRRRG
jgi:hypothetical protein